MMGAKSPHSEFCLGLVLALAFFANVTLADLSFISLGNWGFESSNQLAVAATLKEVAPKEHISFLVSPGSNFMGGIKSTSDSLWKSRYEDVYGHNSLKIPMFPTMGIEDWVGNENSQVWKTEEAYDKANTSNFPVWSLRNWWYWHVVSFSANQEPAMLYDGKADMSAIFIFIDTWVLSSSFPFPDVTDRAWTDLENTLALAPKIFDYIIVVGDKPIYSSGPSKGDSYLYSYLLPLFQEADIDLYISGYDFNMEEIVRDGMIHVTCGSGSVGGGSPVVMSAGSEFYSGVPGFCLHKLTATGLVTKYYDGVSGEVLKETFHPSKVRTAKTELQTPTFISSLPEIKFQPVPAMGRMPGKDTFVKVVGTAGLIFGAIMTLLSLASMTSKIIR